MHSLFMWPVLSQLKHFIAFFWLGCSAGCWNLQLVRLHLPRVKFLHTSLLAPAGASIALYTWFDFSPLPCLGLPGQFLLVAQYSLK